MPEKASQFPDVDENRKKYFNGANKRYREEDLDRLIDGNIWRVKREEWAPAALSTFRVKIYGYAKSKGMRIRTSWREDEDCLYVQRIHPPVE